MTKREIVPRLLAAVWLVCILVWLDHVIPGTALVLLKCVGGFVAVVATVVSAIVLFAGVD